MSVRFGPFSAAIALAIGIALARIAAPPPLACWVFAGALAIAARRWRSAVIGAVIALGAARGAPRPIVPPAGAQADDRVADRITGTVHAPIAHGPLGDGAVVDTGDAAVWVWADGALVPGERIAAIGFLRTPVGPRDPGVADRGDQVAARGADLELTARSIERLDEDPGISDRAWRWADAVQSRWARAIDDAGGDPLGTAALRGIAVGDRSNVPPALDQRWRATGIFHVLSVSGLHLAVVAGLVFALLRRLVAMSPWGGRIRPARWAAPPALVLAVAYTLVTGAQLATLRSLIAIALVLVAAMLDRPVRLIDAIGTAALAILVWRPADLYDPSFQLSFVAATTLALAARRERRPGVRGFVGRALATSFWVALTTAPITAFHFHQVAAGGIVGNIVLTPAVELIALPLAIGGVVLGWAPPIWLASWIVGIVDRGAALLAGITPVGHVAIASTFAMLVAVALGIWLASRRRFARGDALGWAGMCIAWALARTPPAPGGLRVTFLDVGQGDAALVELPDGAVWLIDSGGAASARDLAQASAPGRAITRTLAAYDHTRIALAIVSHPHPDHYLGLAAIDAPIDELWTADAPPPPQTMRSALPGFREIAAALAARGTRIVHPALGVVRREAGVTLTVLAPRYEPAAGEPARCAADPVRTVNDNSLVVAITYQDRTLLFTGDIEAEGEDALRTAGLPPIDVVKVAHHGSPTSSTAAFVRATHPALAVISCGRANTFGFPAADVIARWRAVGAEVARTDLDGAITVTVSARGALAIDRFAP